MVLCYATNIITQCSVVANEVPGRCHSDDLKLLFIYLFVTFISFTEQFALSQLGTRNSPWTRLISLVALLGANLVDRCTPLVVEIDQSQSQLLLLVVVTVTWARRGLGGPVKGPSAISSSNGESSPYPEHLHPCHFLWHYRLTACSALRHLHPACSSTRSLAVTLPT